ncbi:MAG: hypothetical protein JSS78_10900 [Bacteroidetes bacterium]|nr:hypothetical protein [Bacteroidota bacterium]
MKALVFFLFLSSHVLAQNWKDFHFENGDLLFQDIDCGSLCEAIETVTPSVHGRHFSHLGLVYVVGDSTYVIEAIGKDVHLTALSQFITRQLDSLGNPKIAVGRIKEAYKRLNSRALGFALKQLGKPYDDAFQYNNGKYYCSELIYDAYKEANNGLPFFELYPMTFKDPLSKSTFPAWKTYFKNLKISIPEGKPGCNPGSIANSSGVEIIQSFY